MVRGDEVKNDSGSHAVFNEQRSLVLHVTAAKESDVISRLPGCASDAVSAYIQVKNGRCLGIVEIIGS